MAPSIDKVSSPVLLPLAEAEAGTCGSKAAKCGELERMASDSKGLFKCVVQWVGVCSLAARTLQSSPLMRRVQ